MKMRRTLGAGLLVALWGGVLAVYVACINFYGGFEFSGAAVSGVLAVVLAGALFAGAIQRSALDAIAVAGIVVLLRRVIEATLVLAGASWLAKFEYTGLSMLVFVGVEWLAWSIPILLGYLAFGRAR